MNEPSADLALDVTSAHASGQHDSLAHEKQLAAALQEVCEAMEVDQTIDRSRLLGKYPDVREELISCLDNLDFINHVAPQLGDGNEGAQSSAGVRPLATLGDFRIVRELGRGGMGVVYEAEQLSLGRTVALKVLPFATMLDKKQLERFKNESRAAATLSHPNIVPVYSVGSDRGVHYYAMQLIEGQSLAEVIAELRVECPESRDGQLVVSRDAPAERAPANPESRVQSPETDESRCQAEYVERPSPASSHQPTASGTSSCRQPIANSQQPSTTVAAALSTARSNQPREYFRTVAQLGIQAAEGLAHAHDSGIIHRDVKPANLMLDDTGKLWITDFGLAQIETDAGMTLTGDLVGTLRYMSPEQALAKRVVVDHRTDIYSLGITLYELATLTPAFSGRDRQELLTQIAFDEPCPPRKYVASIPRELETIILKATQKPPQDRYASATELIDDLQRFLNLEPIHARRPTPVDRAFKWSQRHRSLAVAGFVVLAVTVVALSTTLLLIANEQSKTNQALSEKQAAFQTSQKHLSESEQQRKKADRAVALAQKVIRRAFLQQATQVHDQPHLTKAERSFLEEAASFYQEVAEYEPLDATQRLESAQLHVSLGDVRDRLGDAGAAQTAYERAIRLLGTEEAATDTDLNSLLAQAHAGSARALRLLGQLEAARKAQQRVVQLRRGATASDSKRRALQLELAKALNGLARFEWDLGDSASARTALRESLAIGEELARGRANRMQVTAHLSAALTLHAQQLEDENLVRQAIDAHQRARQQAKRAMTLRTTPASRFLYAQACTNLGRHLLRNNLGRANSTLGEAHSEIRRLCADYPEVPHYKMALADSCRYLGDLYRSQERKQNAHRFYRTAANLRQELALNYPEFVDHHRQSVATRIELRKTAEAIRQQLEKRNLDDAPPLGAPQIVQANIARQVGYPGFQAIMSQHAGGGDPSHGPRSKIIVAGTTRSKSATNFTLWRLDTGSGQLDQSFGERGIVSVPITDGDSILAALWGGGIDTHQRIVVAGRNEHRQLVVVRFSPNGTIDTSFADNGMLEIGDDVFDEGPLSVAFDPQDNVYVAGVVGEKRWRFRVVALNASGKLRKKFADQGVATIRVGSGTSGEIHLFAVVADIEVQRDGQLVVAGTIGDIVSRYGMVMRLNSDGRLDDSFDGDPAMPTPFPGDGIVTTDVPYGRDLKHNNYFRDVTIDDEGRILVVGTSTHGMIVACYGPRGELDTSFNPSGNGTAIPGIAVAHSADQLKRGWTNGRRIAIDAYGRIIARGRIVHGIRAAGLVTDAVAADPAQDRFVFARFLEDGTLDTTFGENGVYEYRALSGFNDLTDLMVTSTGEIWATGMACGAEDDCLRSQDEIPRNRHMTGVLVRIPCVTKAAE